MLNGLDLKSMLPHVVAVISIIVAAFIYCSPVIDGKTLVQSDIVKHKAQAHESQELRKQGKETLWTSRVFSGMSTFNIDAKFKTNIMRGIGRSISLFPRGVNLIIASCIGFYILLLLLGMNPWVAMIAAIAYGLSSNLLSSIMAGHNTKVLSIAYLAPAMGSVALAFNGKRFIGGVLTALFVGLLISANHYQIVYYFLLSSILAGIIYLIFAIKEKALPEYGKTVIVLVLAGILGFAPNFSKVYNVYEHSQETIRGGKKILSSKSDKDAGGLDRSYAFSWSHGVMESFCVVVPAFMGGASAEELPEDGAVAELVGKQRRNQPLMAPTYIGDQPFLQGVIYFGAAFIFLFILSLFVVNDKIKVWLLAVVVLSFFIAWGRHFSFFTYFLFDYFPLYNKFRTPSMALAMAGISIPALGMLALSKAFSKDLDKEKFLKGVKLAIYTSGGLMLLLLLYGLTNDWMGPGDVKLQSQKPWNNPQLFEALLADRKSLYMSDWMLSTVIMAICAGSIWIYIKGKLKFSYVLMLIALITIGDMWRVSKRYLNEASFIVDKQYEKQYAPSPADQFILSDKDPHYRVLSLLGNPWTDGLTCYHHENIGGHHAAKIQRYQDMIENQLGTQLQIINKAILQGQNGLTMNPAVSRTMTAYNMLNTKYYIVQKNAQGVVENPTACGNAWFVNSVKRVSSHDEEMAAISDIDPLETAIIHKEFEADLYNYSISKPSNSSIALTSFDPNRLEYESNNSADGLGVFSEVYYTVGWKAFIDGNEVPIYRANYILRALKIPAGKHKIEMVFAPSSYAVGENISLAGSAIFLLFAGGMFYFLFKNKTKNNNKTEA